MRPFWIGPVAIPVLTLLVGACARSPAPTPSDTATKSQSTHGTVVNPANIKRVVRELPPNYEVTTGVPSGASPRVIWSLESDASDIRVKPPQCATLADPGDGRAQSAQGVSGSGTGGIVDAVVEARRSQILARVVREHTAVCFKLVHEEAVQSGLTRR